MGRLTDSSSETEESSSTEDFSCFGTGDEGWDIDDPIETRAPILARNCLEKDGSPETSQESSMERKAVENETTPKDRDPSVLERALSQLKRLGWTGTIESFSVYQAKLLTKKRTNKTQAERVKNETPEDREKRLLSGRKKYETKMRTETPEEREQRLEKIRNWRLMREVKRSEEEKKKIAERIRKRVALKKANETLEQREKRNAWHREYQRKRDAERPRPRKQLSEAKRAILLEKRKVRYTLKTASETPEEREERLAKVRSYEKKKKRHLSQESLEKKNARRRELYWEKKRKLKKKPSSTKPNWDVKIEAVQSSVLEVPTDNHSLLLEIDVEPDDLQETLLSYVKEEINPTVSSVTDSQALTSDLLTS